MASYHIHITKLPSVGNECLVDQDEAVNTNFPLCMNCKESVLNHANPPV